MSGVKGKEGFHTRAPPPPPPASLSPHHDVGTSQTYLLFQTLLLLFWLHSCMIWTKLTRTDVVFSRAATSVLLCAGFWIFRYAGKIPKNQIKNQRSGRFQEARGGPQGSQGAPKRLCGAAPPGRAIDPSGWVPHPMVPYFGPIYSPDVETPEQNSFFQSTSRSRRHHLF